LTAARAPARDEFSKNNVARLAWSRIFSTNNLSFVAVDLSLSKVPQLQQSPQSFAAAKMVNGEVHQSSRLKNALRNQEKIPVDLVTIKTCL